MKITRHTIAAVLGGHAGSIPGPDDTVHMLELGCGYGFTALALAVQAPQRVQALVGVEPPMMKYAHHSPEGRAVAEAFRRDVIEPANAAFRRGEDTLAAQIMTGGINGPRDAVNQGPAMARRLQNLWAMKMLALSSDEFPWLAPQALAALPMPVLLFGREFWERVVNFEALVEEGVVSERDLGIFRYVESAAEGWAVVQQFYRDRQAKREAEGK